MTLGLSWQWDMSPTDSINLLQKRMMGIEESLCGLSFHCGKIRHYEGDCPYFNSWQYAAQTGQRVHKIIWLQNFAKTMYESPFKTTAT